MDAVALPSKSEAAYWRDRLFKNTFTYKGRRQKVNAWSVKIQLLGKRKTFSLRSGNLAEASAEACQIYRTIHTQGWDAVTRRCGPDGQSLPAGRFDLKSGPGGGLDLQSWKRRLLTRPYPGPQAHGPTELCVRIEHSGLGGYFPLGTAKESEAAAKAMRIYQTVLSQGWPVAREQFRRELTLGFRWLEDPVAWTYTTLHTWQHGDAVPVFTDSSSPTGARHIAIVEPDAGLRRALGTCINRQEGFHCCAACADRAEALREIPRRKIDGILVNSTLLEFPGADGLNDFLPAGASRVALAYSVFEDSDHLFMATPGGAAGYLLKRTPLDRILEPIAEATGPLTRERVAAKVREYFQDLVAAMPAGPSALETARLTAREQEILALLAKGRLAKEIAASLGISIWTVHGHVKSIFGKLKVHTRTEAVVKFLQK